MSQLLVGFDEDLLELAAEKFRINQKEKDIMDPNVVSSPEASKVSSNVGLDIGTMNIVAAKIANSGVSTQSLRNVFLKVETELLGTRDLSTISHTEIDDNIYILSEDAYVFGNIFGKQVSRPMSKGMISDSEIDSIDVLGVLVSTLIGQSTSPDAVCCYSIPAEPVDANMNVLFHKSVFSRIIAQCGYVPVPLYEGMSIIYSECADTDFSGIGISFGAGMTNIAVAFKGVQIQVFSLARGGDWIDENTASHIMGMVTNRVTHIKEKDDFIIGDFNCANKKEKRVREALSYYYTDLAKYTVEQIVKQLGKIETEFPQKMPIVLSGGTSRAKGFIEEVKSQFAQYSLPFEISEIRTATNQLTAVAEGCLVRSMRG